jgi:hypothetical protein
MSPPPASWSLDSLKIYPPVKKSKEVCTCKVLDQSSGEKPVFRLSHAKLLRVEQTTVDGQPHHAFAFKCSKQDLRNVAALDALVLRETTANSMHWFEHKMRDETIQELYKNQVHYDAFTNAPLVRLCCAATSKSAFPPDQAYDIDLQLAHVVFKKQQFFLRWVLLDMSPSAKVVRFREDPEEDTIEEDTYEEEAHPTPEEYLAILDELKKGVDCELESCSIKLADLAKSREEIVRLEREYDYPALVRLMDRLCP